MGGVKTGRCLLAAGLLSSCSGMRQMVDVAALPRPPQLDVRYATTRNFTKHQLYPSPRVCVHRDTAQALAAVQAELAQCGLGLKIFDGYRPPAVQQQMWDLIRDERYVSNPAVNKGRHTRGTAVDVSLIDRRGRELDMGTDFDDFTERAKPDYPDLTAEQKRNRRLLAATMIRHGFEPFPHEWWHFDLKNWQRYPVIERAP